MRFFYMWLTPKSGFAVAEEEGVELNLSPQSSTSLKRDYFTGIYLFDSASLIQAGFLAKFIFMRK